MFYARILGLSDEEIKLKLPLIVEFAELGEYLGQPVKTYSSGMKSRLGFAVAVHVDPEILILDEVLAVGDALFKRKCYSKMEEFFKAGKTIIYVSHDANSVNRLCSRAVLIHEGKVIMDGLPREVTKYYEKILFSSADELKNVLAEMVVTKPVGLVEEVEKSKRNDYQIKPTTDGSYYIGGMKSKSVVKYNHKAISISNLRVETTCGKKVNVLITGNKYKFMYSVEFKSPFERIAYALKIKDEKGFQLTGNSTHMSEKLYEGKSGGKDEVSWSFDCGLLTGLYYCNAGVIQMVGEDPEVLARVVDGLVFKVIPPHGLVEGGLVYMNTLCDVSRKETGKG